MGFLKITGMGVLIASVASSVTFVATKKYYSESGLLSNVCPVASASVSINSTSSVQTHVRSDVAIANTEDELKNNSALLPSKQRSENIEGLVKQREAQQQQINNFKQFVAADHKKPLLEESSFRYEAEPLNYQWASAQEDKFLSAFTSAPALESFIPTHMSCRSTTCKITIPSQDDDSAEQAYRAVWQTLVNDNQGANQSITYFRDIAKSEVVMYISTQENSIFK